MAAKYIIALDQGTTSSRTILFDEKEYECDKKLAFEAPIKDYSISSFNKLKEDVRSSLKTSKDEGYIKILKRSLVEISQLERTFLIVQNLNKHNIVDEQRPLFFWQNKDRIVVGNVKKNTARRIVPFEFHNGPIHLVN